MNAIQALSQLSYTPMCSETLDFTGFPGYSVFCFFSFLRGRIPECLLSQLSYTPMRCKGNNSRTRAACQQFLPDFLFQESGDYLILGFFFGEAQGHQLCQLLTGDLAYGGLVDEAGLHGIRGQLRHCGD